MFICDKVISKAALLEKMSAASAKDKKGKNKGSSGGGGGRSQGNIPSKESTPSKYKGNAFGKMKPLEAPKMGLLAQHEARMAAKVIAP